MIQICDSGLESRLGFKFGLQVSDLILGFMFGIRVWDFGLGFRFWILVSD